MEHLTAKLFFIDGEISPQEPKKELNHAGIRIPKTETASRRILGPLARIHRSTEKSAHLTGEPPATDLCSAAFLNPPLPSL